MRVRSKGIAPEKADAYRDKFVSDVHQLIWMGFSRLRRTGLSNMHEPEISGMICESIEEVLDDAKSPRWVVDYEIHDDPPVHSQSRKGKHRQRVDIKIASRRTRPRSRFSFEAKTLNENNGVADLLGKKGLGEFTSGSYAADQTMGGMLAYVQTDDCDTWCTKIESKFDAKKHKLGRGGKWTPIVVASTLSHTYQTKHKRPGKLCNIVLLHTMLDCT